MSQTDNVSKLSITLLFHFGKIVTKINLKNLIYLQSNISQDS